MTQAERKRRDGEILFGHNNGDNTKVLATRHGLSRSSISEILRSQGIRYKQDRETRNRCIIGAYLEGKTRKAISEEMGASYHIVCHTININGHGWVAAKLNCYICGETFIQKKPNQKCCSEKCTAENNKQIRKRIRAEEIGIWKSCEFCGKEYKRRNAAKYIQRFCSQVCAANHQHRKLALRNKEIFYLRSVQGLVYRRIGEIFNISTSAARRAYNRQKAKENLRLADLQASAGVR